MTKKEKKELKKLRFTLSKNLKTLYGFEEKFGKVFDDVDNSVAFLEYFIDTLLTNSAV